MANINNAAVSFVIDARNGAVARASLRFCEGKVCTAHYEDEGATAEEMSIAMIAQTISDLEEHGVPRGGAIIVAADRPLRRVFEIRKAFNGLDEETKGDLDSAMEAVLDTVIKPWMIEQNSPLKDALKDLVGTEVSWLMNYSADWTAHDISFMRSHNVHSWELDADACEENGVKEGDKLVFQEGATETGITSPDWNRINGEFTVHVSSRRDRKGNETKRYFVDRFQTQRLKNIGKLYGLTEKLLPHDAEEFKIVENAAF